jgi:hypothetical protein
VSDAESRVFAAEGYVLLRTVTSAILCNGSGFCVDSVEILGLITVVTREIRDCGVGIKQQWELDRGKKTYQILTCKGKEMSFKQVNRVNLEITSKISWEFCV